MSNQFNYPRVTSIIDATRSPESQRKLIAWQRKQVQIYGLEQAEKNQQQTLDNGTALHADIENFLLYPNHEATHLWFKNIQPYLLKLKSDNSSQSDFVIEKRLFSHKYRYTGKPDLIVKNLDGLATIIDWRTSGYRKKKKYIEDKFIQAGAYSIACAEIGMKIEQLAVVVINPKGFQEFIDTPKRWKQTFLDRLEQYYQMQNVNN